MESPNADNTWSPEIRPSISFQTITLPWGLRWRSSTWFIVLTVAVGIFTDLFLYAVIVPVLPFVLTDRIHIPESKIQKYLSGLLAAYAAASFVFSPIAGILADKISGRQKPFLAGLFTLLLSTILLAIGKSVSILVIARILQGMSSAVVWTLGLAICMETVGPSKIGTTLGTIFSVVSVGTQAAPVIGGILYRHTGYIGVFAVCISIIVVDIVLRFVMIEKKTARSYQKTYKDRDGSLSTSASSPDIGDQADEASPLLRNPEDEDLADYVLPSQQSKLVSKVPVIACLKNLSLCVALLIGFIQAFLLGAFDATIPTVALEYYDFDALQAALLFLALGLPHLFLGPLFGWAVDRFGTKPAATLGYAYLAPLLLLLRLPQPGGESQVRLYAILLAFCSVGLAVIDAPSLVEAGLVMERYHKANPEFFGGNGPYAQLYGINSMLFSAGLTLGPLVAGGLKDIVGYGNMNAVMGAVCLFAAVLSFLYIGGRPTR